MIVREQRGDSHNFGRRVTVGENVVHKPRTLLWEWLLLAAASPLRRLLDDIAEEDGFEPFAFGFLPTLRFDSPRAKGGGEVERVKLEPLPRVLSNERRRALARIVGRSLALFAWLGLSDLHWENLVLGMSTDGRIVLAPLDVEIILSDLSLPTQTKLLPDGDPEHVAMSRHAAGVRRVLPYLGKPVHADDLVAMASAYHRTLGLLDRHARTIADTLGGVMGFRTAPIRVLLRGTGEYVRARSVPPWPPLLDAEAEQLDRGDIPYFFRLYGRPGIHWFADRSLRTVERLPLVGDVPRLEPLLRLSRGLRSASRVSLREHGLFTLLGAFDHPSFEGAHEADGIRVTFGAKSLVVMLPDGEELRARRNLRSVVASVYLPCRCGEVRSVFVPAMTACRPARA